jgi:hypothetical protein
MISDQFDQNAFFETFAHSPSKADDIDDETSPNCFSYIVYFQSITQQHFTW